MPKGSCLCGWRGRALPAKTSIAMAGAAWSPALTTPTSAFPTARGCSA